MRIIAIVVALLAPAMARADECDSIAVWRDGQRDGVVCRADAGARGLTVVDLAEDWIPPVFANSAYRSTYLALAQERFDEAGLDGELAVRDRYLELYGIVPTLEVVRRRLADAPRHRCHEAIAGSALLAAPLRIIEEPSVVALARVARAESLRAALHPRDRLRSRELAELDRFIAAVRTVQAHLECDGLFTSPLLDGAYTELTRIALQTFQRRVMIPPNGVLEGYTLAALAQGSRAADFMAALRVLRARVIAATGLVEDGSAGTGRRTVLGRILDPEPMWRVRGHAALDEAAPDLISPATEAAARALGWRDAESVRAFLERVPERLVALPLPAVPSYHRAAMNLEVEIDRGDVWRDRAAATYDSGRRPALILYARTSKQRIALARWPTTVGGWKDEQAGNGVVETWKDSPVGRVVWPHLYVVPRWLPPRSVPDHELVRLTDGAYVLAREQLGPSYRAAFGLVAFVHAGGDVDGIRTHGTGYAASLARGDSHGCHRLLGVHALGLASFVLAHHRHVARGPERTNYRRVVHHLDDFPISIVTLGEKIELVPPIPVTVLPGQIHP